MEKVSIIVPCYNGEHFIDRCIGSIYQQSYPEVELIVIDDGSTDNSRERICAWQSLFSKRGYELKYFYQKNSGVGSAVNTGLKFVSGQYISLLDADDEYLPGAVKERVCYLQENKDVDVVRTNGWIVREQDRFLFVYENAEKEREDVFLALLQGETNNWAGSYMVRSKAMFQFYPDREIYPSHYGQNLQFLLPLTYGKKCGFLDKAHMNYIQIGNSLCRTDVKQEKQKKSLDNAAGYRDIRIHMVESIVKEMEERKYYFNMIETGYWKGIMNIAAANHNKRLMRQAYKNKRKYEKATIDDKILYYGLISPCKSFMYRVLRKAGIFRKEGGAGCQSLK